jgi:hypothetical protein
VIFTERLDHTVIARYYRIAKTRRAATASALPDSADGLDRIKKAVRDWQCGFLEQIQ